ncbi:hypothetical protein [Streptomyces sp. NPDC001348]
MNDPTLDEGTAGQPRQTPPDRPVFALLPGAVALLTAVGMLLLIITGQTEHLAPVAAFGGSVFVGDAAANVTINVMRR